MIVVVVPDFEYHFDEGVERRLLLCLEVGGHVIGQLVDACVVVSVSFQEVFHPSVFVGQFFVYYGPSGIFVLLRQGDSDSGSRLSLVDVEDVAR